MGNNKPTITCVGCGQEKIEAARGMCRTCYSRWRKNGTLDYARDFRDRMCSVEGCDRRAHGHGSLRDFSGQFRIDKHRPVLSPESPRFERSMSIMAG